MIIFLIMLSLLTTSCRKETDYVDLSDAISTPFAKDMRKQYGFETFCAGGGFYRNVKKIGLSFNSSRTVTREEARKIYVEVVEDLLARYNNDPTIRPYLNNYPFEPKNTRISIWFAPNSPVVYVNFNEYENTIRYQFPIGPNDRNYPSIEEPYDEAYKLVFGHERPVKSSPAPF